MTSSVRRISRNITFMILPVIFLTVNSYIYSVVMKEIISFELLNKTVNECQYLSVYFCSLWTYMLKRCSCHRKMYNCSYITIYFQILFSRTSKYMLYLKIDPYWKITQSDINLYIIVYFNLIYMALCKCISNTF